MNTVLTIISAVLVFGIMIFIHELGHFLLAKLSKVKVLEFCIGFGPKLVSWGKDTRYGICALPFGGYVRMEGEEEEKDSEGSFTKAPILNRILILLAGAFMNLLLGFIVCTVLVSTSDSIVSKQIARFEEGALTHQSGLQENDILYSINGRRLIVADDLLYEMVRSENAVADIVVIRDGQKVTLPEVRFSTMTYPDGSMGVKPDFTVYGLEKTFGNVLAESGREWLSQSRLIVLSLTDLVTGRVAVSKLSGPVGIVSAISQAVGISFTALLNLMAMLTINLGIFNLLPIPGLDGGKMLFLVYEAVTGKKPNQKIETGITLVFLALLVGLMLFATFNDISRIFV